MDRLNEIMGRAVMRRSTVRENTTPENHAHTQRPIPKNATRDIQQDVSLATISDERIQELKTMPYAEYLQTPEWKEKRQQVLARDEYRCRVCNGTEQLNVHHRTYERRGNELMSDLTLLCRSCHETYHKSQEKDTRTLSDVVNAYVSQNVENLHLEEIIRGSVEKVLPEIVEQLVRDRLQKMLMVPR